MPRWLAGAVQITVANFNFEIIFEKCAYVNDCLQVILWKKLLDFARSLPITVTGTDVHSLLKWPRMYMASYRQFRSRGQSILQAAL